MKSRYIVFPAKQEVAVWEEAVVKPGPDELLCKAQKSLISTGTEGSCLRGVFEAGTNWEAMVQYPFRPGYSMAAQVVAVGEQVQSIQVGERVAAWIPHQEYFRLRADDAHLIPEGVSNEEATWSILACTTQLGIRRAELTLGETVAVVGLGILGQLVVQYLVLSGARRILAIDPLEKRLELAASHGATHCLAMPVQEAVGEVAAITDGKMLDALFEISGHPEVLAHCLPLMRRLGRIVLLGDTPTPSQQHLGPGLVSNSIAILGIHGTMMPERATVFNPWTPQEMAGLFFEYLLQGRMRVGDLITRRVSPLKAPQVYPQLLREKGQALGVIFDWERLS
jgi:threonine dehydrogenase-like Zn-dependent dehydrogenase